MSLRFLGIICNPPPPRVFVRITEMPVQNNNFTISARPDLATNLLQILKLATFDSLVCEWVSYTSAIS